MKRVSLVLLALATLGFGGRAGADEAKVVVGGPFAQPPDGPRTVVHREEPPRAVEPELRRSPARFEVGPAGITSGKGFGYGLGVGIGLGTGSVGGRVSAGWFRGEGGDGNEKRAPTGESVGHYQGELVLDLYKRGPVHPIVGLGFGFVHVGKPQGSGSAAVGTGRIGLEYAMNLDDADVRFGAGVTGALVGPRDDELKDLKGYVMAGLTAVVGF